MSYKTLMVHLDVDGDNAGILKITGELAARFDAKVIGIAACQPAQVMVDAGLGGGDLIMSDLTEISRELKVTEAVFHNSLSDHVPDLEWRSATCYEPLADYLVREARAADLIVTGRDIGGSLLDETRRVRIGDLALRAGRPVLLVPQGRSALDSRHVIVGWKDSRESRRAVMDALPLLRGAAEVTVLEVTSHGQLAAAQARVRDVSAWLARHGVNAEPQAVAASGTQAASLHAELLRRKCDLLVAGAYGHGQLREWAFGGVTEDILLNPEFFVLLSH